MSSVTFPPAVGGDGSTVTDDTNATTGLASGGHRTRFVPALSQVVAVANNTVTKATEAAASAATATTKAAEAASSASSAALTATSTSSLLIAVASKTFAIQASKQFIAGMFVTATSAANSANFMYGQITSYSGTTLIVNVTVIGGSGTLADWNIAISGARGATGATGAAGASPGMVLLAVATASNSATVDFTSLIDSTYDEYRLVYLNAVPATDIVALMMHGSKDAGVTWLSTNEYSFTNSLGFSTAAESMSSLDGTTRINLSGSSGVRSVAGGGLVGISGEAHIIRPSSTRYTAVRYESNYDVSNTTMAAGIVSGAGRIDAGAGLFINGLRLFFGAGNIVSGEFKLYGMRKAV